MLLNDKATVLYGRLKEFITKDFAAESGPESRSVDIVEFTPTTGVVLTS